MPSFFAQQAYCLPKQVTSGNLATSLLTRDAQIAPNFPSSSNHEIDGDYVTK